jgi:hypothetical protein
MNARTAAIVSRTRMKRSVTRIPSTFAAIPGLVPHSQDIPLRFTILRHGQMKLTRAAIVAKIFPAPGSPHLL